LKSLAGTVRLTLVVAIAWLAPDAGAQTVDGVERLDEGATPLGVPASSGPGRTGERKATGIGIGRTVGALGVVAGLAGLAWVGVRTLARAQGGLAATLGPGGRAPSGLLEVLGRYPVGRGQTLVLLRVDRRVLPLPQTSSGRLGTPAGFTTLSEITDAEEVASILVKSRDDESASAAGRFSSMLRRFDEDYEPAYDAGGREIPVVDLTRGGAKGRGGQALQLLAGLVTARTGGGAR